MFTKEELLLIASALETKIHDLSTRRNKARNYRDSDNEDFRRFDAKEARLNALLEKVRSEIA